VGGEIKSGRFKKALFLVMNAQQGLDPLLQLRVVGAQLLEVLPASLRRLDMPSEVEDSRFI
jgi:hypothetical protein